MARGQGTTGGCQQDKVTTKAPEEDGMSLILGNIIKTIQARLACSRLVCLILTMSALLVGARWASDPGNVVPTFLLLLLLLVLPRTHADGQTLWVPVAGCLMRARPAAALRKSPLSPMEHPTRLSIAILDKKGHIRLA